MIETTKYAFAPLINQDSEVLILGTLPGEDSLRFQEYYGHKRNQFWRIIGELFGHPLVELDYAERCSQLLSYRLALWDTLKAAKRQGSLDSNIREPVYNDIPYLLRQYPNIHTVCFNGKQAGKFFQQHIPSISPSIMLYTLPSTSPAYTLAYAVKLQQWQAVLSP